MDVLSWLLKQNCLEVPLHPGEVPRPQHQAQWDKWISFQLALKHSCQTEGHFRSSLPLNATGDGHLKSSHTSTLDHQTQEHLTEICPLTL